MDTEPMVIGGPTLEAMADARYWRQRAEKAEARLQDFSRWLQTYGYRPMMSDRDPVSYAMELIEQLSRVS